MRARQAIPWLALFLVLRAHSALADEPARTWRFGVALGYGTQDVPRLRNAAYAHETTVFKLLANRPLAEARSLGLELQLEPFFGVTRHRLLNPYFLGPTVQDYLAQRARFTAGETVHEYGVDVGLLGRWTVTPWFSLLVMGSIGPMYGDTATERLARGIAFSDIVAVGAGFHWDGVLLEVRPTFRHVSNGYLQLPNGGHNAGFVVVSLSEVR